MKKCDPDQMEMLRGFSIFILIFSLFFTICILLGSCRSLKTETVINYRDSIITHTRFDTIRITITDTIHVEASSENESESETEIQFGEGGGTYNALTGEATNVNNVKQNSKEKELQRMMAVSKHITDSIALRIDSLNHIINNFHAEEHNEQNTKAITPRSGWDKFCTWWTVGSWILLILLAAWWAFKKFYLHR